MWWGGDALVVQCGAVWCVCNTESGVVWCSVEKCAVLCRAVPCCAEALAGANAAWCCVLLRGKVVKRSVVWFGVV
jgi:hypothetical protein